MNDLLTFLLSVLLLYLVRLIGHHWCQWGFSWGKSILTQIFFSKVRK